MVAMSQRIRKRNFLFITEKKKKTKETEREKKKSHTCIGYLAPVQVHHLVNGKKIPAY